MVRYLMAIGILLVLVKATSSIIRKQILTKRMQKKLLIFSLFNRSNGFVVMFHKNWVLQEMDTLGGLC